MGTKAISQLDKIQCRIGREITTPKNALTNIGFKQTRRKITHRDDEFIVSELRKFKPLYVIALKLGVCRTSLENYIKQNFPILMDEIRQSMIDYAEHKLMSNVQDGNQNAIQYMLDRLGKDRGYGPPKQEVQQVAVPTINIGRLEIKKEEVIDVRPQD